jgi:hypothetical protein
MIQAWPPECCPIRPLTNGREGTFMEVPGQIARTPKSSLSNHNSLALAMQ